MLLPLRRLAVTAVTLACGPLAAQQTVRGTVVVLDRDQRPARDVDDTVIWLERERPPNPGRPDTAEIMTRRREFIPRVTVVVPGDAARFPNRDGFNHNVFSLSEEAPFDLGLYGQNETRATPFTRPGVVRVYCNVHATMSAYVVVVPERLFARPAADGGFTIANVPPGRYTLRAWHERGAQMVDQMVDVTARAPDLVRITLDASGFRPSQHLNKYGQPYRTGGRRY